MNWFARIKKFLNEVWTELQKASWPSKKEVYGTTLVVIITVLITAAYLWVVDVVLNSSVDYIFLRFGGG